jgi:hypothetical protein
MCERHSRAAQDGTFVCIYCVGNFHVHHWSATKYLIVCTHETLVLSKDSTIVLKVRFECTFAELKGKLEDSRRLRAGDCMLGVDAASTGRMLDNAGRTGALLELCSSLNFLPVPRVRCHCLLDVYLLPEPHRSIPVAEVCAQASKPCWKMSGPNGLGNEARKANNDELQTMQSQYIGYYC